jgi:hypothetical protein
VPWHLPSGRSGLLKEEFLISYFLFLDIIRISFSDQDYESKKLLAHECSYICFLPLIAETRSCSQTVSYPVCLHDTQIQEKNGSGQSSCTRSPFRN